jgi:hypothetical protein
MTGELRSAIVLIVVVAVVVFVWNWWSDTQGKRRCPRCGRLVDVGRLDCPSCDFDFRTIGGAP